jgi:hypothetical protein
MLTSNDISFLSICARNYLPQARRLLQTLHEHHASANLCLVLVEEDFGPEDVPEPYVDVLLAKDIVGDSFYQMALRLSVGELSRAIKPLAMRALMSRAGSPVVYVDPDCCVYSRFDELIEAFADGAGVVLTPHCTRPIDDDRTPSEADLLRGGAFNPGFVAVASTPDGAAFLDWWSDKLWTGRDLEAVGGVLDQKWVDLAPSLFENVRILKHPGYNLAYWNVFQHELERRGGSWLVDGEPLRFFHFSDIPREDVSAIARGQNRITADDLGAFQMEFESYLARLAANRGASGAERAYSYAIPFEGELIESQALRSALRRAEGIGHINSMKDFAEAEEAVKALLAPHPALPPHDVSSISRLLYDSWASSKTLPQAFPLFDGVQRARFLYWVMTGGHVELGIHPLLLPWRDLHRRIDNAAGGAVKLTPFIWMIWLMEPVLRHEFSYLDDAGAARLIGRLARDIHEGARPALLLDPEHLASPVVGKGADLLTLVEILPWAEREDLRNAFNLTTAAGRTGLKEWIADGGIERETPWLASWVPAACKVANA